MARYILDIPDKIIAHIRADYGHGVKWINEEDRKILVELIYNAKPIEEVTPIVRGKWEFDEKGYYCNKCGYRPFAGAYQFCAVCGADMRSMKEKTTINSTKTTITDGDLIAEIDKLPRIKVGNSNSPTVKYCIDEVLLYDLLEK